jgi:hypothetical protein
MIATIAMTATDRDECDSADYAILRAECGAGRNRVDVTSGLRGPARDQTASSAWQGEAWIASQLAKAITKILRHTCQQGCRQDRIMTGQVLAPPPPQPKFHVLFSSPQGFFWTGGGYA